LAITPALCWQGISHPRWLISTLLRTLLDTGVPHFENASVARGDAIFAKSVDSAFVGRAHFDWEIVRHIRQRWTGKLVLKGILRADDALRARDTGADGIVISNHGGRQLDHAVAPLRTLPAIASAVGADLTVMLDGGIRRGADVLKALALGARFVFVGRPFLYAAAIGGAESVEKAIALLAGEIDRSMGMLGVRNLDEVTRDLLAATKSL